MVSGRRCHQARIRLVVCCVRKGGSKDSGRRDMRPRVPKSLAALRVGRQKADAVDPERLLPIARFVLDVDAQDGGIGSPCP
jgi:hypothetical protein